MAGQMLSVTDAAECGAIITSTGFKELSGDKAIILKNRKQAAICLDRVSSLKIKNMIPTTFKMFTNPASTNSYDIQSRELTQLRSCNACYSILFHLNYENVL
jgi:hypothetical protein